MYFKTTLAALLFLLVPARHEAATASGRAAVQAERTPADPTVVAVAPRLPVSVPTLGYLPSPKGVLPLQGVPGSAVAGTEISLNRHDGPLAVSSTGGYAAAAGRNDGELIVYRLGQAEPGSRIAPSYSHRIGFNVDRIAASPLGGSAVGLDRDVPAARLLRGLPGSPSVSAEIPLSGLAGSVTALAVADNGLLALVAVESGSSVVDLYRLDSGGAVRIVGLEQLRGLAFIPGSHDAVAADGGSRRILRLVDGGRGGLEPIFEPPDGLSDPRDIAAFADGTIAVADAGPGILLKRPRSQAARVDCACRPEAFHRLSHPDSLRLTADSARAAAVLRLTDRGPQVYHIPVGGSPGGSSAGRVPLPTRSRVRKGGR